jgi:hypothetical protein
MKVCVWGDWEQATTLTAKIRLVLEELGLTDFVVVETTVDAAMKEELKITELSALIIEEESINFKDMIFEWIVPEPEELKSMFISIIGGWSGWWCGSKDETGSCWTGCAC